MSTVGFNRDFRRHSAFLGAVCFTIGACSLLAADRDELSGNAGAQGNGASARGSSGADQDGRSAPGGAGGKGDGASAGTNAGGVGANSADGGDATAGYGAMGGSGGTAGAGGVGGASGSSGSLSMPTTVGLVLWLKADDGVLADNDDVIYWFDSSMFARHARQDASTSARPKRVANALNKLPVIQFDGIDDHLVFDQVAVDWSSGVSFFSVATVNPEACGCILSFYTASTSNHIQLNFTGTNVQWSSTDCYLTWYPPTPISGSPHLFSIVHAPPGFATLAFDREVKTNASGSLPTSLPFNENFLGRGPGCSQPSGGCGGHSGTIAEVMVYARALGLEEYKAVENYLETKWHLVPD